MFSSTSSVTMVWDTPTPCSLSSDNHSREPPSREEKRFTVAPLKNAFVGQSSRRLWSVACWEVYPYTYKIISWLVCQERPTLHQSVPGIGNLLNKWHQSPLCLIRSLHLIHRSRQWYQKCTLTLFQYIVQHSTVMVKARWKVVSYSQSIEKITDNLQISTTASWIFYLWCNKKRLSCL